MELKYLGHFFLPHGICPAHESVSVELRSRYAKFGYGGRAMCLADDPLKLWISGHDVGDLVAQVRVPGAGETATITSPFQQAAPPGVLREAGLDTLVGLAQYEGKLWALWQDYYDVDGGDSGRPSLWNGEDLLEISTGSLKLTSGYLTRYGGTLWCGRSDAAGSAAVTKGPVLWEKAGDAQLPSYWRRYIILKRLDWTRADRYTALVFLPGHVCWLVRKAVGKVWYGGPVKDDGAVDEWGTHKGYHTNRREVWLLRYSWPGLQERSPIVLREFHESAHCGGLAYDETRKRLYVHELWPPEQDEHSYPWERPRVHVYDVEPEEPDPKPERESITVEVTIDGKVYSGDLGREFS